MLAVLAAGGCSGNNFNSWFDPSIVGRWEYTPTVVPILEHLDVIEEDKGDFVETSQIMPEDLIPEASEHILSPGDGLTVNIMDFFAPDVPSELQRIIDGRNNIDLPQIGRINLAGLTAPQAEKRIASVLRDQGIIQDALVTVQVISQRDETYTIFGAVPGVGRYVIAEPNFRLLDALTEAGGAPASTPSIFVIRQIPLTDEVRLGRGFTAPTPPEPDASDSDKSNRGTNLQDLIQNLTEPDEPSSPGAFATSLQTAQPAKETEKPLIDLPDEPSAPASQDSADHSNDSNWVFLDGKWLPVTGKGGAADSKGSLAEGPDPLDSTLTAGDLVTQRVIEVPMKPLLQGNAAYNIVIRPGDRIRVPPADQGVVYVGGIGINRPGVYNLPVIGRLTLTKVILAAGGLAPIGVPNRTDLTRMVGTNRQATIRLNLKSIFEGSEPDVFLKPDDVVNIGTTWWAQPLAVIRNGFRTTYGFGFLLDRNFGNDVFGPPPFSRAF
jgi:polysaccharide biosynthesis/export protein